MPDPVLHLVSGPNGAGKSTLWALVLEPELHLEFVNADEILAQGASGDAYEAAAVAEARREELIEARRSFATETVFSHPSKVELVEMAVGAGYLVTLHVVVVPVDLAVDRVDNRVENDGHAVPEEKVRQRYERLWGHIVTAIGLAERSRVYDNTTAATPFRPIAEFERGTRLWSDWPSWAPAAIRAL